MSDREAALQMARAALPYFQDQYDRKPNWHTAARLADAERTVAMIESGAE